MKKIFLLLAFFINSVCNAQLVGVSPSNVMAGALPVGVGPNTTLSGSTAANTTYNVAITFTSNVTGFVVGDISKSGTATATLSNFTTVNASSYNVDVVPTTNGTVVLSISASVCLDGNGRDNLASNTLSTTVTLVPVNTVVPVANGSTLIVGDVLSATHGTWLNTPTSYTYQWVRDGVDIASATASSYTLVSADDGLPVWCDVIATNGAGSGTKVSSNHLAIGFSVNNSDLWIDLTDGTLTSGIAGDNENLLRPTLNTSDANNYTSTILSPGGLRMTPSYNYEGVYFNTRGGWSYGSTTDWKYLHDGTTSYTFYMLIKPLETSPTTGTTIFRTTTTTTGNTSAGFRVVRYNNTYKISMCSGTGGTEPYIITGSSSQTINSYNILKVTYNSSTTTLQAWIKPFGGSFTSIGSDNSGTLSSSSSGSPLNVGGNPTDLCYLKHIVVYKQILSGSNTTSIESWLDGEAADVVTPTDVNVYLFGGQSNNGTADNTGIASELNGAIGAHVYYLDSNADTYSNGFWAEMQLGVNQNPNLSTHGYQMRMGYALNLLRPTYWLGRWVGSSGLINTLASNSWSAIAPSSNGDHFPYFTDGFYTTQGNAGVVVHGLNELKHIKRKNPIVRGFVWCQGEYESGQAGTTAADYQNELYTLVTSLITILNNNGYGTTKLRVAVLRTSDSRLPSGALVRTGQADAVTQMQTYFSDATRATLINTDDAGISGGHYNASGQDLIGTRLANYYDDYVTE